MAGFFCKLRWANAPAFCGEIKVISATDGEDAEEGTCTIVLAVPAPHLQDGDKVDFSGVGDLGTELEVTVVDEYTFTVEGVAGSGYGGTGHVICHNGEAEKWNDIGRKGNFVFKEWKYNFRDFWESVRLYYAWTMNPTTSAPCNSPPYYPPVRWQALPEEERGGVLPYFIDGNVGSYWLEDMLCNQRCVQHTACCPDMIAVVPNVPEACPDTLAGIALPNLSPDAVYGSAWFGRVEQWMMDPLYQPPGSDYANKVCHDPAYECITEAAPPCSETACPPDDGTDVQVIDCPCKGTTGWFPIRPYEEAMCAVPTGAPKLPEDCMVGCGDHVKALNSDPRLPVNATCTPPYEYWLAWNTDMDGQFRYAYYYQEAFDPKDYYLVPPWILQAMEEECVESQGTFHDYYEDNGVDVPEFEP